MMNHMKGPKGYETEGPRLIFEKKLTKTNIRPDQSRLLMPFKSLIRNDFLRPGIGAILVDQRNVKVGLMLTRWDMKKNSGGGTLNYALTCGSNDIVKGNRLKKDDDISFWSFRCHNVICFALVLPP
ncbi:hypothetical protein EUTSA_v10009706mg, partial [Eutrema salsugineum]